jgi:integrase
MTSKNPRAITVRSLEAFKGPGRLHCGTKGLFLQVTRSGSKLFIYRFVRPNGKTTETSVGPYGTISLADAREKVAALAREIALGRDPIAQKREQREKAREQTRTFKTALDSYVSAPAFRDLQATATLVERLNRHAGTLMKLPLASIDTKAVAKALAGVHETAQHTGRRTLAGIARVFDYARVAGLIDPQRPNPATFKGAFEFLWGPPRATVHLRAINYQSIPDLYQRLCELDMTAAFALRFCILSATRTKETLYTRFDELDLKAMTWTLGAERMKMKLPHVVPITDEMLVIIEAMRERHGGELIFASDRHGGKQHPRSLAYVLQHVLGFEASVYGTVRSGFRDWAGDCTEYPREVAEAALAHRDAPGASALGEEQKPPELAADSNGNDPAATTKALIGAIRREAILDRHRRAMARLDEMEARIEAVQRKEDARQALLRAEADPETAVAPSRSCAAAPRARGQFAAGPSALEAAALKETTMKDVCSSINKSGGPKKVGNPAALTKIKQCAVYEGRGGSSSKLSSVGRYEPGTLIDGQISLASERK